MQLAAITLSNENKQQKTSRPFYLRYNEHNNSIKNNNSVSAPSDYCKSWLGCGSINDFHIDFLDSCPNPLDATLIDNR